MAVALPVGLAAVAAAVAAYTSVIRPRINRWGATDEEVEQPLPGDELPPIYGSRKVSTRAITIDASPVSDDGLDVVDLEVRHCPPAGSGLSTPDRQVRAPARPESARGGRLLQEPQAKRLAIEAPGAVEVRHHQRGHQQGLVREGSTDQG